MDSTDAPATSTTPRSIGERLRAGRLRAGLSSAAAAEKLHLDIKVIEALEADRFNELGASVYVRGHLRRYADFVGEPGAELVSQYTTRAVEAPPPDLTQIPQAERRSDPRRLVSPLIGVAAAATLVLAIWWVLSGSQGGSATPGTPEVAQPQVAAATPAPDPSVPQADSVKLQGATQSAAAPAVVATQGASEPATPPAAEAAPVRDTRLTLQLSSESWVEVYDSRGERLFYDVASAGSVQSVAGRPPLRVVLGNAHAVAVEIDGQPREIPSSAIDGDSARFVVNRSGSLSRSRQ